MVNLREDWDGLWTTKLKNIGSFNFALWLEDFIFYHGVNLVCCKNLDLLQYSITILFLFVAQDELFSRNRRQLRSKEGKTLERINTDFLLLRRHATNPGVSDSMVNTVFIIRPLQLLTCAHECRPEPGAEWLFPDQLEQFRKKPSAVFCA